MNTLQSAWDKVDAKMAADDKSSETRAVARVFFYSGAAAMMDIFVNVAKMSESAGQAVFNGVADELYEFNIEAKKTLRKLEKMGKGKIQ